VFYPVGEGGGPALFAPSEISSAPPPGNSFCPLGEKNLDKTLTSTEMFSDICNFIKFPFILYKSSEKEYLTVCKLITKLPIYTYIIYSKGIYDLLVDD